MRPTPEMLEKDMKKFSSETEFTSTLKDTLTVDRVPKGWLALKAAATRHRAPFVLQLPQRFLEGLAGGSGATSRAPPPDHRARRPWSSVLPLVKPRLGWRVCMLSTNSSRRFFCARSRMWKSMPEIQLLLHRCEWQTLKAGHRQSCWCDADEDFGRPYDRSCRVISSDDVVRKGNCQMDHFCIRSVRSQ